MGIAIDINAEPVAPSSYLVVGSPNSVADGSYQNTLSSLATQNMQAQLWDRIVEGGVLSTSRKIYSNVILLVGSAEIGQASMVVLLKEIEASMIPGAHIETGVTEESWFEDKLKEVGFVDIARSDRIVARKAEAAASEPLRLASKKNPKEKKAVLWELKASSTPSTPDIDESKLLTTDDHSRRVPIQCDVKKTRKPCKNCTCGLKEVTLEVEQDVSNVGPTSSCGSCALGDAFRCDQCPYKGLPAFEPGQKIELGSFLANDV